MCTILQQANKPITKKISTFLIVTSYNKLLPSTSTYPCLLYTSDAADE